MEYMVSFHTGYEVDETDYQDVKALCQRFGLELPLEIKEFVHKTHPSNNHGEGDFQVFYE